VASAGLKRILAKNDDVSLRDAMRHEQEIFQSVVITDQARAGMRKAQSACDSGSGRKS
jgi:hypothetical protein